MNEPDYIAAAIRHLAVPIDSIVPDPANARTHSPRNLDIIRGSLRAFRQQTPIVVDSKGVIHKGNGTWQAGKSLGWDRIAVIVSDLNSVQMSSYGLADNRAGETSEWDNDALATLLQSLTTEDELLAATGFNPDEIAKLIGQPDLPADAVGTEYTEAIAGDVEKCPHCGMPL
jgi:ParB-like chromosome segregation protein Spo0J